MKLLKLEIVGFGRLTNETYELTEGLNRLCRSNGWGKSTLAVFIKAMLYGLPASRKTQLDENERKKYRPWSGGRYGGALEFESVRGRFRVERFFGAKEQEDSFVLLDLATNKPSTAYTDAPLGVALFGIDEEGFERSVYLSQRVLKDKKENASIHAKLSDALENVEDLADYDRAIELLEKRRRFYVLKGERGAINDTASALGDTLRTLERTRTSADVLAERREALKTCETARRERMAELEELRALSAKLAHREARAALEKEKHTRLSELARLTEEKKQALTGLGGRLPTEEELKLAVRQMDELERERWRIGELSTPDAKDAERRTLAARFSAGIPSAEELEALSGYSEKLRAAALRRDALKATLEETVYPAGQAPTEATLSAVENRMASYKDLTEKRNEATRPIGRGRGIAALLLLAIGGILLAVGAWNASATFRLPLLITGGALLFVGAFLGGSYLRVRKRWRTRLAHLEEGCRSESQALKRIFASYGCGAEHLEEAYAALRELVRQHRARRETLERYDREIREAKEKLFAYFRRQERPLAPTEDVYAAVETLRRERERLMLLENEHRERQTRLARAKNAAEQLAADMRPFLSLYPALTVENERQTLRAIVERKKEYLRLKTEIEERERALERFVAEHLPPSEEEMLPTAEELRERIALCQAELEHLEQEQNRLRPEVGRLEEDADAVAELEARAAAEERQLAEYRANAATIQTAEKLLGEAKEALSTRYMAGMQRSFLEALSYFPPQIMPEAVLSTSFDVLTREGGETHPEESLSRGLRDAVQFCVRLALAKELFAEGEQPFLLLDDPFVNLDDDRMEAVKEMLERLGADYQVLHLVCSTARL